MCVPSIIITVLTIWTFLNLLTLSADRIRRILFFRGCTFTSLFLGYWIVFMILF